MNQSAKELMRYYRYIFDNEDIIESDVIKLLMCLRSRTEAVESILQVLQEAEAKRIERQLLIESIKRGQWFIKHWRILLVVSMAVAGFLWR